MCGCDEDKTVNLSVPKEEGRRQRLVTASYVRTSVLLGSDTMKNLELSFPEGDYRVSIVQLEVSGSDGDDSLKGGKQLWVGDFHAPTDGYVGKVEAGTFEIARTVIIISGRNTIEQNVQQVIIPNAENPSLITEKR